MIDVETGPLLTSGGRRTVDDVVFWDTEVVGGAVEREALGVGTAR